MVPIVGFRSYTEEQNQHRYCSSEDTPPPSSFCEDYFIGQEECCPNGVCQNIQSVLSSYENEALEIKAYSGTRYLELADALDINGLGCRSGSEPMIDETTGQLIAQEDQSCIHITQETLDSPLQETTQKLSQLSKGYCMFPSASITTEDLSQVTAQNIQVSTRCALDQEEGGQCGAVGSESILEATQWTLEVHSNYVRCPAQIVLQDSLPAGTDLKIELQ